MPSSRSSQLQPLRDKLTAKAGQGVSWSELQSELQSFTLSEDERGELALHAWALVYRRDHPLPYVRYPDDIPFPVV